jgi:hypothetical protein
MSESSESEKPTKGKKDDKKINKNNMQPKMNAIPHRQ